MNKPVLYVLSCLILLALSFTACSMAPQPTLIAPLPPINSSTSSIFLNALAYTAPDMEKVGVRQDAIFAKDQDGKLLRMDVYYPPDMKSNARLPVVIFVFGFPDGETPWKGEGHLKSWGRLVAASGMIGISYETYHPDSDLEALVTYIQDHAAALNIDAKKIGLFACSAHPPTALSYAMQPGREYLNFLVLYYGLLTSPDNYRSEEINQLGKDAGFYASELKPVTALRKDLPLFIVRAGKDEFELVPDTTSHFVEVATAEKIPVTFVDYADGIHGFDLEQHTEQSSQIIQQTLTWMKEQFK